MARTRKSARAPRRPTLAGGPRVFISSVVHDLVDLRRELETDLVELGLEPTLSESEERGIAVRYDADTVESCLESVDEADNVVVILSREYGTTIEQRDDLSMTHLEYQRACKPPGGTEPKPVLFCVRDHLFTLYNKWRRAGRNTPPTDEWVPSLEELEPLLKLIDEHDPDKRWVFRFRTVVDLKKLLRRQLGEQSMLVKFREAVAAGQLPLVQVSFANRPLPNETLRDLYFQVTNVGATPAILTECSGIFARPCGALAKMAGRRRRRVARRADDSDWAPDRPAILRPSESRTVRVRVGKVVQGNVGDFELHVAYGTIQGPGAIDPYLVRLRPAGGRRLYYLAKRYDVQASSTLSLQEEEG